MCSSEPPVPPQFLPGSSPVPPQFLLAASPVPHWLKPHQYHKKLLESPFIYLYIYYYYSLSLLFFIPFLFYLFLSFSLCVSVCVCVRACVRMCARMCRCFFYNHLSLLSREGKQKKINNDEREREREREREKKKEKRVSKAYDKSTSLVLLQRPWYHFIDVVSLPVSPLSWYVYQFILRL